MKYVCLIYIDEKRLDALPEAEIEALWSEAEAYSIELRKRRGYLSAQALEPIRSATTLRKRNGTVSVTDGPFAETKEQLGGFVLIDAANLDEAIRVATELPAARIGSVEVRPIREV
jgi:hypothetical protein